MSALAPGPYYRTAFIVSVIALSCAFALSDLRLDTWNALLPFFEWMETSLFGVIGKTWGAAFAIVEAFHLMAMALLGGAVLVSDGRLLGVLLTGLPSKLVLDNAHKIFLIGLGIMILTGIFMACGVAMKIYYLNVYWYKMLALTVGIVFVFFVKRPLFANGSENVQPWITRLAAISSLMIWFTVAATGRWIGFSG